MHLYNKRRADASPLFWLVKGNTMQDKTKVVEVSLSDKNFEFEIVIESKKVQQWANQ